VSTQTSQAFPLVPSDHFPPPPVPEVPAPAPLPEMAVIEFGKPDRYDLAVPVLVPSGASRLSPFNAEGEPRAQHVSTKSSTSLLLDPKTSRVLVAESTIESKAVLALMADRTIAHIQDQPSGIRFIDIDGVERLHTFDFRAERIDGDAFAIFAKNKERAEREDMRARVHLLADQLPSGFASEIVVLTEEDFPAWLAANNTLLVSVRFDPRTHVDDMVREAALLLEEPIAIGDLASRHGGGGVAFRPIVRLLDDGILELVEPARIDGRCMVRRTAKGAA